jgi:hypothetical protein
MGAVLPHTAEEVYNRQGNAAGQVECRASHVDLLEDWVRAALAHIPEERELHAPHVELTEG